MEKNGYEQSHVPLVFLHDGTKIKLAAIMTIMMKILFQPNEPCSVIVFTHTVIAIVTQRVCDMFKPRT